MGGGHDARNDDTRARFKIRDSPETGCEKTQCVLLVIRPRQLVSHMIDAVHHQRDVFFVGLKEIHHLAIEIPGVQWDSGYRRVIVVSRGMLGQFFEIDIPITSMMKIGVVDDETCTRFRGWPTIWAQQSAQKMQ